MPKRSIAIYPDERLWMISRSVNPKDIPDLQSLMDDMWETLEAADGVGLSAIQVGEAKQIILLRIDGRRETYINPILAPEGCKMLKREGCLSLPGIFDKIYRFPRLRFQALNEKGEEIQGEAEGLRAHALQHEMEHLDGRMFSDKLPKNRRREIKATFSKIQKAAKLLKSTVSECCYGW